MEGNADQRAFLANKPGTLGQEKPNSEVLEKRIRKLLRSSHAMGELRSQGFDDDFIRRHGIGLVDIKASNSRAAIRDALCFPRQGVTGATKRYIHLSLSKVTSGANAAFWAHGDSETHYAFPSRSGGKLIVCRIVDLFHIIRLIEVERIVDAQVIAYTGPSAPTEWKRIEFWQTWDSIFSALPDSLEDLSRGIMRAACQPVFKITLPQGVRNWAELSTERKRLSFSLEHKLAIAESFKEPEIHEPEAASFGRSAYKPVDIGRAYHNGYLYYPVKTILKEKHTDKNGNVKNVESLDNVVIRSDGEILTVKQMPCKPGTPMDQRVWRLSDRTLVNEPPAPPTDASWSWQNIQAFLASRNIGASIGRPFKEIIADVRNCLVRTVWLPNSDDYTLLALVVAASFVQPVFKAVPYVLVCGEKGTGKSQLGILLSQLGANGSIIGQVSAASAARKIHETRGLIVFDDLEGIGQRRGNDGGFTELIQFLKVSYNVDTAKKVWTDSANGYRVRELNGFGIKIINNTQGVDGILGSRMIRVSTHRMPKAVGQERRRYEMPHVTELKRLQDDLHVWAFESVAQVDAIYRSQVPASQRAEQIAAPLRVLAELAGDVTIAGELESALARSATIATNTDSEPADIIREAAANLVRQGQFMLSATNVALEARRMVGPNFGKAHAGDVTEIDDEKVVGRYLKSLGLVENIQQRTRTRGVQYRSARATEEFLQEVFGTDARPSDIGIDGFCTSCVDCSYAELNCPIQMKSGARSKRSIRRQ
jgi:hypothetical protein